jgi:hypothetical protein
VRVRKVVCVGERTSGRISSMATVRKFHLIASCRDSTRQVWRSSLFASRFDSIIARIISAAKSAFLEFAS